MRHFSAARIEELLTYGALADAIGSAFADADVNALERWRIASGPAPKDVLLIMPAWRKHGLGVVKIVTVRSANAARALPSVQGTSLVFDDVTGAPVATLDATALTRWRTAATSLLAARYLARPDSSVMLMAGSGGMAEHLIRAFCSEFPLHEILIWSRMHTHAQHLASRLVLGENIRVSAIADLESAVKRADIVSTATLSETGLVAGNWVKPGAHIDLVGAYSPQMRESDDELIRRAMLYVDTRAGALREAGDLVQPLRAGVISAADIRGELRELVHTPDSSSLRADASITLFKSVGHSIEDLAAAELVLSRAGCFT